MRLTTYEYWKRGINMNRNPMVKVELNLQESGTLCNTLMAAMVKTPRDKVPKYITALYIKLAKANDKLMGKK